MSKKAGLLSRKTLDGNEIVLEEFDIDSIWAIIRFINYIQTKKIVQETDLSRHLGLIARGFKKQEKELRNKLRTNEIVNSGNKFYPITYRFKDEDASIIQQKLTECITYTQKLFDRSIEEGHLIGLKETFILGFQRALENILENIDLFRNQLSSRSIKVYDFNNDCNEIYDNGARLVSLDEKAYNREEEDGINSAQELEEYVLKLRREEQSIAIKSFIKKHFSPNWILNFSIEVVEKILKIIIKDEELGVTTTPNMLNEMFLRLPTKEREDFLSYISVNLDGTEKNIIMRDK
jgi:hypothetical protein